MDCGSRYLFTSYLKGDEYSALLKSLLRCLFSKLHHVQFLALSTAFGIDENEDRCVVGTTFDDWKLYSVPRTYQPFEDAISKPMVL